MIKRVFSSISSIKLYAQKPETKPPPEKPDYSMPRPHAIRMNEAISEVITYKIPNRPLTPLYEVPLEARIQLFPYFDSPAGSKILSVSVVGPPNSGKSSIINSIMGSRILSVSRKINTTHKVQEAIKTKENTQLILNDTPGLISTHSILTNKISTKGWEIVQETDLTLFVVDAVKVLRNDVKSACSRLQDLLAAKGKSSLPEARISGETHAQYSQRLARAPVSIPAYLVVNKVDLSEDRRRVKYLVNELKEYAKFSGEFFVSAVKNYNIDQLEDFLFGQAKPGQWKNHPLQKSNLSDIDIVSEVVREQVLNYIHDELPYRWVYRVVGWTPYLDGTLRIDIDVLVKTEIHKGIFIGRDGMVIKKVKHFAESWLSGYYQRKVLLNISPKIMSEEIKKASYKGIKVEIQPPHSNSTEILDRNKVEQLKLV